jgi:hypothetical protein
MRTIAHACLVIAAAGIGTVAVLLLRSAGVLARWSREVGP